MVSRPTSGAVAVFTALLLAAAVPAAATARPHFKFCVGQGATVTHPRCDHRFVLGSRPEDRIYSAFRARHALRYQVCVVARGGVHGGCNATRPYHPRTLGARPAWDLQQLAYLSGPGHYRVRLYLVRAGRSHLVATRRVWLRNPHGLPHNALPIAAEVAHLVDGYDSDGDGVINFRKNEFFRADRDGLWDGTRLFLKVLHGTSAELVTPSALRHWLKRFDTDRDGRLSLPSGELGRACKAVWGDASVCRAATLTVFEKSLGGAARAASAPRSLPIRGFVRHWFSHKWVYHHQQVAGYDSSFDDLISVYEESFRVDDHGRVWSAVRFLNTVYRHTGDDVFISRADLRSYLRGFDADGNGRIDEAGGEFRRLYRAVWHRRPAGRWGYRAFERRFHG
jgi:Ca2+-binding EF-hand superfamily protein